MFQLSSQSTSSVSDSHSLIPPWMRWRATRTCSQPGLMIHPPFKPIHLRVNTNCLFSTGLPALFSCQSVNLRDYRCVHQWRGDATPCLGKPWGFQLLSNTGDCCWCSNQESWDVSLCAHDKDKHKEKKWLLPEFVLPFWIHLFYLNIKQSLSLGFMPTSQRR